ncbi:DUF4097 family beta strand repeat-containing protein [Rhodohalobacter mucosus]|uniref:DUF4097 domain-containing protein n=1 Tax=Rhodohalobacter mucosus TaxID=2079485 RepID=A0A316TST7_9BACT|nr:DUF4097 family beta strand repeat-containing protein [Rhodohalobacter mucosus]PWN07683.1 hypothetical protein DDZ15_01270 [Rhodohalobacter mucosus]
MFEFLKKLILLILSLLTFTMTDLLARQSGDPFRAETFQTSSTPDVQVSTSGGSVIFHGQSSDEVRVYMYARRNGSYLLPSDTDLENFDIIIEQRGNGIVAEARRRGNGPFSFFNRNNNISISFEVYLPEGSAADGRTSGGSVSAENLSNALNLRTSGGSVNASNISGNAELRTSGGSINLENINGTLSAGTSGGSIRASNLTGMAELSTSGGSIRLDGIAARISARTSGGSIRAEFIDFSDDIELRTSGGNINIDLPQRNNYDLELRGSRVDMQLRNFTGEVERNYIKGVIGEGGPLLNARTSGGSVTVRQ